MSTAKERQAKRRAKIKADPELYQAQLLKDRERKNCIPRFPLSKTPEVFTNALLVHNLQSLKSEDFSVESQKALLSGCAYNDYFQSKADLVIYHKAQENTLKFVSVQSVPCPKEEIAEDASFITAEKKKNRTIQVKCLPKC